MSTIAADPLALMPRGDAVTTAATAPATPGESADFALALADVMSAEMTPPAAVGAGVVPVPAELVADAPPLLEGLGRIAVPVVAVPTDIAALPDVVDMPVEVPAPVAVEAAVTQVDGAAPEPTAVGVALEAGSTPAIMGFPAADGTGTEEAQEAAPETDASEDEMPVVELAEAVSVAVATIVATPVAAPQAATKAELPQGDAGAESVRMAGAGMLMSPTAKPREAKGATAEAETKERAASEGEVEEKTEAAAVGREKSERPETKPIARPVHAVAEHGLQPHAERRAPESPAVKAEPARMPDPAATAAPLPGATPMQAAATPTAPVAMDRPGWEGVVTERIVAELSQDGQQIELELSPDNLGGLKIRLEVSDGQAQVRFVTETPEAARLIQQNEHRLSESLSRAGLSLGGHDSASRDAQQQQGDRSGQPAPRGAEIAFQRSGEPRPGMVPQRAQVGLVNLMA